MKRCWLGLGLLGAVLALSIWASLTMAALHAPVEEKLTQAAQAALAGNAHQSREEFRQAKAMWNRWEPLVVCLADHTPVEAVSAGFAQLEVYQQSGDAVAFAAGSCALAQQVQALGQSHALIWENLF